MRVKRVYSNRLWRRHAPVKRWKIFIVLLCIIGLLGGLLFQSRPIMTAFAESQAIWTATKVANRVVAQVLKEYTEVCANVVSVTYDGAQRVSSVRTDASAINTIRTEVTDRVITEMEQFSILSVSIPLGTLSGWHWLSGLGPILTFPISFTATVLSDVSSSLVSDGINQSAYRVEIHLTIRLYVVSPMGRSTVGSQVDYPMAEVVLLGEVPDNLTEVYGDDQSLLGKIFDYGTSQ